MFGRVCQHQSLRAELVSNKSAAVDLVPLMITQLAPVRPATGKLLLWLHLTESDRSVEEMLQSYRMITQDCKLWNVHISTRLNHLVSWTTVHSVHALKHARGCVCPSVWVTSVCPPYWISGPADCVSPCEWEAPGVWCGGRSPPLSLWPQISGPGPRGLARLRWPQRWRSAAKPTGQVLLGHMTRVTWPSGGSQ